MRNENRELLECSSSTGRYFAFLVQISSLFRKWWQGQFWLKTPGYVGQLLSFQWGPWGLQESICSVKTRRELAQLLQACPSLQPPVHPPSPVTGRCRSVWWQLVLETEASLGRKGCEWQSDQKQRKEKRGDNTSLKEVGQSLMLWPVSLGSLGTVIATVWDGDCTANWKQMFSEGS